MGQFGNVGVGMGLDGQPAGLPRGHGRRHSEGTQTNTRVGEVGRRPAEPLRPVYLSHAAHDYTTYMRKDTTDRDAYTEATADVKAAWEGGCKCEGG